MSCGGHRRSLACRRDTLPAPRTLEPRAQRGRAPAASAPRGRILCACVPACLLSFALETRARAPQSVRRGVQFATLRYMCACALCGFLCVGRGSRKVHLLRSPLWPLPPGWNFGSSVGALGFGDIRPVRRGGGRCGKNEETPYPYSLIPGMKPMSDLRRCRASVGIEHTPTAPSAHIYGSQTAPPSVRTHTVQYTQSIYGSPPQPPRAPHRSSAH